ncbi:MAG: bifunctional 5,10-methylenetetrahydrofolate dehydrogenase/5,10-methenyltetrahydrofolate cyclohydrolase [Chloroflexia bacterium]|nr:bifunctional 5,10-methylenetetrahydrofolate dehydrogenase/5,10-methenyltetrahydrofolate cyclohydrolase [Chloroflexia bacterium]MDQ3410556.1 bifunctional 5,10-methylenetetrahydrofolate dehydrogenase/5,10-methenyltetrahydrofolate cyclohydrolase [Chloroflexota bacterium]
MTSPPLLRGAPIASRLRAEVTLAASLFRDQVGGPPLIATLLTDRHPSALAYRDAIDRGVRRVGIDHRPVELATGSSSDSLIAALASLNQDRSVHGILVLMPLPADLSVHLVFEHLAPLKDVDGITPTNAGRLHLGLPSLRPSTPQGGIEILDFYGLPIAGQNAVVIGRSNVVGKPFATMLTHRHATVTTCHRQTRDLADLTRRADIVAVAAGHPGLINRAMLKPGAVVLDFGVNVVDGEVVGDADATGFAGLGIAYTPVPGGTGPVTTLVLAHNTVAAAFASLSGSLDAVATTPILL